MRDLLSRDLEIATNTTMPPAKATVNGHKQTLIKSLETFSTKAHIEGGVASVHRTAEKAHSRKPSSRLLGARVQSKPNTRANNRVIDEAHFEVAEVPLKRRIQRTIPDTGW